MTTGMDIGNSSVVCSSVNQTDVDRLSELPKPLIHHILSYLDMKEVVQTCLVSRSWRCTWQGATNITICGGRWKWPADVYASCQDEFNDFVDRVLDLPDTNNIFKLSINCGCFWDHDRINDWIRVASQRQVKELILDVSWRHSCTTTLLPELLFDSAIAVFKLRDWAMTSVKPSQVPNSLCSASHLRELVLYSVKLPPGDSNGEFIFRCPILEILIMWSCDHHSLKVLDISTPQLKTLGLDKNSWSTCHCIIKICTPKLTSLDFGGSLYKAYYMEKFPSLVTAKIKISSGILELDKGLQHLIHMVKAVYNVTTLQLECFHGHPINQDMLYRLPNPFCNLQCLMLKLHAHSFIRVAHWFRNSEIVTLVLEEVKSEKEYSQEELPLPPIFSHIKFAEVKNFEYSVNEQRNIQFLLENLKVLTKLTISMPWYKEEDMPNITKWLSSLPKASSTLKIHFRPKFFVWE